MKKWTLLAVCLLLVVLLAQPVFAADPADSTATKRSQPIERTSSPEPLVAAPTPVILNSFDALAFSDSYWGVGLNEASGDLWLTDFESSTIRAFNWNGKPTGKMWTGGLPGVPNGFCADQEYDEGRGLMYTVWASLTDARIHTWYPATGALGPIIDDPNGLWTATSQRGVAYDPATDTLYIGGWNQRMIYRIQGLSWPTPGKIIKSWQTNWDISGLAWLSDGKLAVVNNDSGNTVYVVKPKTMEILSAFTLPSSAGFFAGAGVDAEKAGPAWLFNQKDRTAYRVDLGRPYSKVTLLEPHKNAVIRAGSMYTIHWGAPATSTKFTLKYSVDNGATWKLIAKDISGSSYSWHVDPQVGNKTQCLVKVTAFDASGGVSGTAVSQPFRIEVLKVTAPNGGEFFDAGVMTSTISWETGSIKRPVAEVEISLTRDGGVTWMPVWTYTYSNPGTHDWLIPHPISDKTKCKIKVVLKDMNGAIIGKDTSDKWFTIDGDPTG